MERKVTQLHYTTWSASDDTSSKTVVELEEAKRAAEERRDRLHAVIGGDGDLRAATVLRSSTVPMCYPPPHVPTAPTRSVSLTDRDSHERRSATLRNTGPTTTRRPRQQAIHELSQPITKIISAFKKMVVHEIDTLVHPEDANFKAPV